MNKYQKALYALYNYSSQMSELFLFPPRYLEGSCKILKELVDKSTPIKPIKRDQCGGCEIMVVIFNGYKLRYCPNCGQKIDWSNEE